MDYVDIEKGRPLDVIPIGRICMDFNPVDYFKPWTECETFKKYVGGSPANIAAGLSRLGKKVGFLGCVSDDQMGDFCIQFFQKEGIDVSHVVRARHGESMGLAFTEILDRDTSSLIMYRDNVADLKLEPEDVDEEYIKSAGILVVSGTALSQSPSREAVLKAIEYARKNKTLVVFDIDYRAYTWKNSDEISLYYTMVARQSDIIMGSREEYDLTDRLIHDRLTDEETARRWFGENGKIVVIKHGKKGSTAYVKGGQSYSIKPFPVEALKSFGGGDGYGSAFLYGLLEGLPIETCLEFGSASASMLVSSHGCSADMPDIGQIRAFIADEKLKFGEMVAKA